jgi:uncharacterized protein (DUF362 family)
MNSKVALVKVDPKADALAVREAVNAALEMIGAPGAYCSQGDVVLVKPNFGAPSERGSPSWRYVNPLVASAALKVFSDWGCKVLVGEDPLVIFDESAVYTAYKLPQMAAENGAELVSLRHGPHELVNVPGNGHFEAIEVSRHALDATLVVSLAKMKTIGITHVSLSLKNMKGLLPPRWKRRLHCDGLSQGIVDLNRIVRPGLAIVDGIEAADEASGTSKPVGLILAGDDCVAVDAVSTRIMGLDPREVDHIMLAERANLGTADLDRIEILGERLKDLEGKFTLSPPPNPFELAAKSGGGIRIVQGNPCSACLNELGGALGAFGERLKEFEGLTILVGPDATLPETGGPCVLVGNCLKRYQAEGIYVHGCPPCRWRPAGTGSIRDALLQVLDQAGSPL